MRSYVSNRETWRSTPHALLFYQNYGQGTGVNRLALLIGEDELSDNDFEMASLLVDSFARAIAETEETAFVAGTGHDNNQSEGFSIDTTLAAATITTTAVGTVTIEKFLEMIYTCPSKFRKGASFLVHSLTELYAEAGPIGFKVHKRVGGYCIRPANKSIILLPEHA